MIRGIDHIVLTVSDIPRSVQFYQTVLGLEAITFAGHRRALLVGDQKINLQTLGEETRNHARTGSGDVCLIIDTTIPKMIARLGQRHVPIVEGPVVKSGAKGPITSLYINDPDGNLIELSSYD